MIHPKDIINLIADNVIKTKNPFGVPKFVINTWWKKTKLPQKGDALLFTGLMYQFAPYIETSTSYLARFEDTRWADYLKYGKYIPKLLSGLSLAAITPGAEKKQFNGILTDIADILTKSKVDFFYDPGLDDYSGVLLYDLGDLDGFVQHARHVAAQLKQNGIRKLITRGPPYHLCLENTLSQIYGRTLRGPHLFRTAEFDVEKRPQKDRVARSMLLRTLSRAVRCAGQSAFQRGYRMRAGEKLGALHQLLRRAG
jgi:Fe-S oxidoreductase